jgi:hypothetical protein
MDRHLDHMCAFWIWIEMLTLGNFHGGLYSHEITCFHGGVLSRNTIFFVFVILSWNQCHEGDSRNPFHDGDSHEISSWRWPLTKYHKKPSWKHRCKPSNNVTLMRVAVMKIIHGSELSWKFDFSVSIIVRVHAWWCTLTHYFHESKTIFCDMFCTLTKFLDSGSAWCHRVWWVHQPF